MIMTKLAHNTIILTILFLLAAQSVNAQNEVIEKYHNRQRPKLVVELIVGGLRYDQLYRFRNNLSEYGFKRLAMQGTSFTNARSSYMYTSPECGSATLASGANPSEHGIIGSQWVNYTTNKKIEALHFPVYKGIGCNEDEGQFSPESLTASTLADEIRSIDKNSKIYSLAQDYSDAIIHGGYKPTGCYWLDVRYGGFVTSSYYTPTLAQWVVDFNATKLKWEYTNALWAVDQSIDRYIYKNATSILLDSSTKFSFDMLFKPKNREFKRLTETPMGNSYLTDFAIETIKRDSLGKDESTDLLVINFASQRNISRIYGTTSTETEDAYYKLDKDISKIIEYLDNNIGSQNFVIILTSSHGMSDNVTKTEASNEGKFNAMQFKVLISGFLNAQLGTDNWVTGYNNRQIYLNRRLIYEKNLSLEDIQNRIASFALQFSGVANAVTSTTLQTNYYGKGVLNKMQNSYFPRHGGDLMINLLPGWIELENEDDVTTSSLWGSPYEYDSHVPLLFYGKGINPQIVHTPVDVIDVAPTICEIVGVTHPNASEGKAISEIISAK